MEYITRNLSKVCSKCVHLYICAGEKWISYCGMSSYEFLLDQVAVEVMSVAGPFTTYLGLSSTVSHLARRHFI